MARTGFVKRHRATIASGVALALAASAVVVYAVTASGYKAHQADLNDGGVWVVNGTKGWSGRLNKPINQLDGVVPSEDGKTRMDIIQDGAAVVTLNLNASRGQSIEPSKLETLDGGVAAIPTIGFVRMAGGTLASADAETGKVWAVRYDDAIGKPIMTAVDRQSEALATVGKDAALAVSQGGVVVLTSADEGTVTTVHPAGADFEKPVTQDLPGDAGQVSSVTTVGERIVTLDATAGVLRTIDGVVASVPADSVLQQAGPAADSVLVASPGVPAERRPRFRRRDHDPVILRRSGRTGASRCLQLRRLVGRSGQLRRAMRFRRGKARRARGRCHAAGLPGQPR